MTTKYAYDIILLVRKEIKQMEYNIDQICKCANKLDTNSWNFEQYISSYRLVELIAYFSGKYSLCYQSRKKLGPKKDFAKKLPVLLNIFNKYCEIEEEYVDTSWHGSPDYEATGAYIITGKIPEVLGKIIIKEYEKNWEEDTKYINTLEEKEKDKKDLEDETTRDFYETLMK